MKSREFTTTSAKIRFLNSKGLTRSQIARELDLIYQHVRNVLIMDAKKAAKEATKAKIVIVDAADTNANAAVNGNATTTAE